MASVRPTAPEIGRLIRERGSLIRRESVLEGSLAAFNRAIELLAQKNFFDALVLMPGSEAVRGLRVPLCYYEKHLGLALDMAGRDAETLPYGQRTNERTALPTALTGGRLEEAAALYAEVLVLPLWGPIKVTDSACAALMAENAHGQRESEPFGLTEPTQWSVDDHRTRADATLRLLAVADLAHRPELTECAITALRLSHHERPAASFNFAVARHPQAQVEPLRSKLWQRALFGNYVALAQEIVGGALGGPPVMNLPWDGCTHLGWKDLLMCFHPAVQHVMESFAVSPHGLQERQQALAFFMSRRRDPARMPVAFVQGLLAKEVLQGGHFGNWGNLGHHGWLPGFRATALAWAILVDECA